MLEIAFFLHHLHDAAKAFRAFGVISGAAVVQKTNVTYQTDFHRLHDGYLISCNIMTRIKMSHEEA